MSVLSSPAAQVSTTLLSFAALSSSAGCLPEKDDEEDRKRERIREMARLDWANQGRNGKLCSYKRSTAVICAVNVVAALYVLHFLYTSFFIFNGRSNAPPAFFGAVKYTNDQIRKMEESIRIRRAAEPIELIKLVEGIKAEFSAGKNVSSLSRSMKQMIADEVLQRLKGMKSNANVSEQRESLEVWRREKMEEVRQLMFGNATSNSTIPAEEANILQRVLESEWFLLLEDIGVWIPAEIIHKERNDTLQNEEDLDDEIVAGRPLPPECHAKAHTDYDGTAVKWGLTHHKESAADCCQACLNQAKLAKPGEMKCNIWVYCPAENGCYSPDIYTHKHQECWLKQAEKPKLNFKDRYSESYRSSHPKAPLIVPWMSGVVS